MEAVILIWVAVFLVGLYQVAVPYKPQPPLTPEELEREAYYDYIIANSSSEDS